MPRGDRTGPNGMGPMTGRGAGYCSGSAVPGYVNPYGGRGFGAGYGRGFGRGCGFGSGYGRGFGRNLGPGYVGPWGVASYGAAALAPLTSQNEKEFLERQTELLENNLQAIRKRLNDLNKVEEK